MVDAQLPAGRFGFSFHGLPPECGCARYGNDVRNGTSLTIDAVAERRHARRREHAGRRLQRDVDHVVGETAAVREARDVGGEHAEARWPRGRRDVGVQRSISDGRTPAG